MNVSWTIVTPSPPAPFVAAPSRKPKVFPDGWSGPVTITCMLKLLTILNAMMQTSTMWREIAQPENA